MNQEKTFLLQSLDHTKAIYLESVFFEIVFCFSGPRSEMSGVEEGRSRGVSGWLVFNSQPECQGFNLHPPPNPNPPQPLLNPVPPIPFVVTYVIIKHPILYHSQYLAFLFYSFWSIEFHRINLEENSVSSCKHFWNVVYIRALFLSTGVFFKSWG